jgi:hypothetical protein
MGAAGHGQPGGAGGSLMLGSLEMLKTDDLMDRHMSSYGLGGGDTFRSNDWIQQLHGINGAASQLGGINSYTMLDVAPPHDGGGGGLLEAEAAPSGGGGGGGGAAGGVHGGHGQAGGGGGGPHAHGFPSGLESERRLSMKLNSISLDLDGVDNVIGGHR